MRLPPPLLMLAAGVVQRALSPSVEPSRPRTMVAAGLATASATLAGAASARFQRSGTTVQPFWPERSSTLVTSGPNAVTRNPMYVGMAGLLVANAVHRGSWRAVVPAAAFVVFIDRYQVRFEERALATTFGTDYEAYRAAVPRWLDTRSLAPALPRRDSPAA
jgi:protein-S-isoprenylcysteine O-methyltransferase Ste14